MSASIRLATPQDSANVQALAKKIWNAHYPGIISQDQIDYMLDHMYSQTVMQEQITHPDGQFLLAESDGMLLGFLFIEQRFDNTCYIHKLYVDTESHGAGVGSALMCEALTFANGREVTLNVHRRNIRSVNFYFKMGFIIESAIDKHFGQNYYMNDFVMVKKGGKAHA